ncbi:TPA: hypothetical protein ACSCYS_004236 [Aeromonas veronii]
MMTDYADGLYWTHPKYGPSVQAAWRKVEIKNGVVRILNAEPAKSAEDTLFDYHTFSQYSFFDVNTMVGKAD